VLTLLACFGCGAGAGVRAAESAPAAAAPQPAPVEAPAEPAIEAVAVSFSGDSDLSGAGAVSLQSRAATAQPAPVLQGTSGTTVSAPAEAARMIEIEGRLTVQVEDVERAADRLRRATLASGGDVVEEALQDAASAPRAQMQLRVPSARADDLLREIAAVGTVTSRQVTAKDVGKQYFDATLRLENLSWTLARFEQILARANSVDEILRVEQEIARVRGQIEQIKGELRYLRDRSARATLHVTLLAPEAIVEPPIVRPRAKFYPGLRATFLRDLWSDAGNASYAGGGVSLRFARAFSVDIDGLRGGSESPAGLDVFLATLGGELYSEFLGAGRRKWLNPYLGLRAGYARLRGRNEMAAGGTLGLELFNTELASIELDARFLGMFGTSAGAHLGIEPALAANIAF
jgi:hypothetical protein